MTGTPTKACTIVVVLVSLFPALSILFGRVSLAMTFQVASTVKYAHIFKRQTPRCWIGPHDRRVKIHQVAVVKRCSLRGTDAMSIMA